MADTDPSQNPTANGSTEPKPQTPAEDTPTPAPAKDETPNDKPKDADPADTTPKQLTIKQLKAYPPDVLQPTLPDATTEGQIQVGASRRKPFWLSYKLYGSGPCQIVWLCGHGDTLKAWQRHVQHFGVDNGEKYTSLLVDTRGVGESEAPFGWWSMSELARDMMELLDKIEWVGDRSVHFVGHSMGGMMVQEIVCSTAWFESMGVC